jgi:glycerol-3-phosphate acyltransferase PlsY
MNDRIRLINSIRSNFGERKKSVNNRLAFLKILAVFISIILVCATYSALSSLLHYFDLWVNFNWSDSASLILVSLGFIIMAPTILFEIQLLNHLKNINQKKNENNDGFLNREFEETINDLNENSKSKIIMIVLTVIMLIGALINSVEKGELIYWNNFIIPYLLLVLIIVIQVISGYNKLKQNIKAYEQQ